MADFGNLDNAGTGFALDEDDDLESLLAEASEHEEPNEEGDTGAFFRGDDVEHTPVTVAQAPTPSSPVSVPAFDLEEEHFTFEEPSAPQPQYQPAPDPIPQPAPEPTSIPVQEVEREEPVSSWLQEANVPTPVVQEEAQHSWMDEQAPAPVSSVAPVASEPEPPVMKVTLPSAMTDQNLVARIIRVVDAYRGLNDEEKTVVSQFINNGEPVSDVADFVVKTLNVDPMLTKTMRALKQAKEEEPVDRAFYVMDLDRPVLHSLGGLVAVFTSETIATNLPTSSYARQIVRAIESLDNKAMNFVSATESVLVAAEEVH